MAKYWFVCFWVGFFFFFILFCFLWQVDRCGMLLACPASQSPSLVLSDFHPVPEKLDTLAKECEILENTCLGTGGKQINSTPAENKGYICMGEEMV